MRRNSYDDDDDDYYDGGGFVVLKTVLLNFYYILVLGPLRLPLAVTVVNLFQTSWQEKALHYYYSLHCSHPTYSMRFLLICNELRGYMLDADNIVSVE